MENNNDFVSYEYKDISVKRDSVAIYTDCLSNFGWMLIDKREYSYQPVRTNISHSGVDANIHAHTVHIPPEKVECPDIVALKFKRDRHIGSKLEVDRLERKCKNALSAIGRLERKNNAYTMGTSLGAGLVGAAFLGLAVYSFMSSNTIIGVLLTIAGIAGWGVGFIAYHSVGRKKSSQAEPMIQEQLDIVYSACEQAHALLA